MELTTKLNQQLTKSMSRRCSIRGIYTSKKHLCRNLGIREGGGDLLKGDIFSETYGIDSRNTIYSRNSGYLSKKFCVYVKKVVYHFLK